jgi:hypothetical protein
VFSLISSEVDFGGNCKSSTHMEAPRKTLPFGEYFMFLPSVKPNI